MKKYFKLFKSWWAKHFIAKCETIGCESVPALAGLCEDCLKKEFDAIAKEEHSLQKKKAEDETKRLLDSLTKELDKRYEKKYN